jgi:hypothetical protein
VKNLVILGILFVHVSLKAQDKSCPCNDVLQRTFETKLQGQVYQGLPGLTGEEFFNVKHAVGDIYLENGSIAYDKLIRYNGRIDGLLLYPGNSYQEIILDKFFIKKFSFKNFTDKDTLYFEKLRVIKDFGNDSIQIYGQVLYENKLSLYAYRRYISDQEIIERVGSTQIYKKFYEPSFVYYFKLPNNKTIGFKSFRKRQLYKLFPENKDLMKKLFRERHQRRFRKEEDLIKIADVLNTMYN